MRLLLKLKNKYPEKTILHIVKLLYSFAELSTYWFETYLRHY